MDNGRCNLHGGKQPKGIARHGFKHGRYSKYMPADMLNRYHEGLNDDDLISMREELALLDARLAKLLSRIDTGESNRLWQNAQRSWDAFRDAQATEDKGHIAAALNRHNRDMRRGRSDVAAWLEIENVINLRRRVASEERRRLVDLQQMMTVEQMMTGASALLESVRRNVSDRDTLAAIQSDFSRLMGRLDS